MIFKLFKLVLFSTLSDGITVCFAQISTRAERSLPLARDFVPLSVEEKKSNVSGKICIQLRSLSRDETHLCAHVNGLIEMNDVVNFS